MTFTATVSDVNIPSQDLSISWSSNHDGTIGTSVADSAGNVVFSYSGLSINDHTITLVVQDEIEAECTTNLQYTVGTPPEINIVEPTDGAIFSLNDSILFHATISDLQDSPEVLSVSWESDIDGVLWTDSADTNGNSTFEAGLTAGSHNIVLTVTDTDGLSSSHMIYVP